jgi:hypothetical protein
MTTEQIKAIQRRIGTTADGVWGPLSRAACQRHLRALMPSPNPWPLDNEVELTRFYGKAGDESNLVTFEFPFPMYYAGKRVLKSRCHRLVKDSLLRVLGDIGMRWANNRGIMEEAEDYGGIYNFRPMRGSKRISRHSWGIAIDLDPDDNGLHDPWPQKADMPLEIMEAFAKEGFINLGWTIGRDAMHFQATR